MLYVYDEDYLGDLGSHAAVRPLIDAMRASQNDAVREFAEKGFSTAPGEVADALEAMPEFPDLHCETLRVHLASLARMAKGVVIISDAIDDAPDEFEVDEPSTIKPLAEEPEALTETPKKRKTRMRITRVQDGSGSYVAEEEEVDEDEPHLYALADEDKERAWALLQLERDVGVQKTARLMLAALDAKEDVLRHSLGYDDGDHGIERGQFGAGLSGGTV
jgi:hypothetical protein